MFSAFLHGYLLSFGLILPLGPQNELVFSQKVTPPKLCRALPAAPTEEVAQAVLVVIIWISAVYLVYNLTRM